MVVIGSWDRSIYVSVNLCYYIFSSCFNSFIFINILKCHSSLISDYFFYKTCCRTYQNYSLGKWVEALQQRGHFVSSQSASHMEESVAHDEHVNSSFRLYLFAVLLTVLSTVGRVLVQMMLRLRGAQVIHDQLARTVLTAPMGWFDSTPIGRIINRFSADILAVDMNVSNTLRDFVDSVMIMLNTIVVIAMFKPTMLLLVLPAVFYTVWIVSQFIHVSRDLKRLESISKSPCKLKTLFGDY